MLYLCGLAGVCAVNYIVFSISTLYYVGYPLLLVYGYWAVSRHMAYNRSRYICAIVVWLCILKGVVHVVGRLIGNG